jgi:hypothetical protein
VTDVTISDPQGGSSNPEEPFFVKNDDPFPEDANMQEYPS